MRRSALLFVMMLAAVATNRGASAQFPPDSGVVNARTFGAKGDGKHDDTAALTAAISAAGEDTGALFWRTRIVVLPAGTYRVSAPLMKRYANGKFGSGMILIGESPTNTTIRLADHAPGFGNAAAPRGVIMTTAKLLDGSPTSGGKDYTNKGEGNDAYENFVENLTIDVGAGNPGAIGIDYLANNIGAIHNVRVTAPPGSGAVGISMQRKWPGPALLQRVDVQGFATGIAVANTEYGVTLDHVRLGGQRDIGLANDGNAVTAADLTIDAPATAIANRAPGGLIALTKTVLRRNGEGATALSNHGSVVAHGVMLEGFAPPDGAGGSLKGVWQGEQWKAEQAQSDLTLEDSPIAAADPPSRWVNVTRFVQPSDRPGDITAALRAALASGAATVYLPHGRYTIDDGIAIPPTLRRFVGMNASITVRPERQPSFARDTGMFRIDRAGPSLVIERLAFDMTDLGDQLAVQVSAQRDVTLRDIVTAGTSLLDRGAGGGRVFIEDVCCGKLHIAGPSPVYARQLNTEGGEVRIVNDGSPLAILGLKTEGVCTVLENRNGARSVIHGGQVDVSRGWDIDGGFEKRAAGFFRSSISAAMLLPVLAAIIAPRIRSWTLRLLFLALTCGAVALTTQKGALVAVAAVSVILCMPVWSRYSALCTACIAFALAAVVLPLFTLGLLMPQSGGVFSFASFAMRISRTWPEAWQWILSRDIFPFGVGLGGIGGAQRFYAPNFVNPSDNLFVYLYANFGVLSLFYLGWLCQVGRRLPPELRAAAIAPLAVLAFNLGYGAALSMLEDQMSSLFIGAAAGMLWQLRQMARAGLWSDPYGGARMRLQPSVSSGYAASYGRALRAR